MGELQALGMQEHAVELQGATGYRAVRFEVSIFGIADDGVAGMGQVHADLHACGRS